MQTLSDSNREPPRAHTQHLAMKRERKHLFLGPEGRTDTSSWDLKGQTDTSSWNQDRQTPSPGTWGDRHFFLGPGGTDTSSWTLVFPLCKTTLYWEPQRSHLKSLG